MGVVEQLVDEQVSKPVGVAGCRLSALDGRGQVELETAERPAPVDCPGAGQFLALALAVVWRLNLFLRLATAIALCGAAAIAAAAAGAGNGWVAIIGGVLPGGLLLWAATGKAMVRASSVDSALEHPRRRRRAADRA